jgi:acyl carrier protein
MISEPQNMTRHSRIVSTLQGIVGRVLRIEPRDIDVEASFLELGADSLALVEALRGLQEAFGVKMGPSGHQAEPYDDVAVRLVQRLDARASGPFGRRAVQPLFLRQLRRGVPRRKV